MLRKDRKQGWRQKVREQLALAFGGKCTICGYDKCLAAFDYHHVDSSDKDRALSIAMKNGYAWSRIVEEARKCTLVCCRCHREIHAGLVKLPKNYTKFNEEYADIIKLRKKEYDKCPICKQSKPKRYSYCSHECSNKSRIKFEVQKEELEELVSSMSLTKIGKMFDVSDNAIRKRCKKLGIEISKSE